MRRSRGRGRVDDDWIERASWKGWGPPTRGVEYDRDAHRLLGPLVGPPRAGGYRMPVHVGLVRRGGDVQVEVAGYRIGRLNAPTAQTVRGLLGDGPGERATVCGLVTGGDEAHPQLEVRLWLDRRLQGGHDVAAAHQREAIT